MFFSYFSGSTSNNRWKIVYLESPENSLRWLNQHCSFLSFTWHIQSIGRLARVWVFLSLKSDSIFEIALEFMIPHLTHHTLGSCYLVTRVIIITGNREEREREEIHLFVERENTLEIALGLLLFVHRSNSNDDLVWWVFLADYRLIPGSRPFGEMKVFHAALFLIHVQVMPKIDRRIYHQSFLGQYDSC